MKLGIAGTGAMVRDLMQVLPQLELEKIWLFGRPQSEEKTRDMAQSMTGYVLSYDELLKKDIDTVYIALPNDLHAAYAKQALMAGKNVILEKPATSTEAEMRELAELVMEKDLMFAEAMNIHSLPAYQALKNALPRIGKVKMAIFNYTQYSSRYDRLKAGDAAPVFTTAHSGGALMDLNVYNIQAILGLFGSPLQVRYSANLHDGVDTSGTAVLSYEGMQAVAIGAKDCAAPCVSTIEGEEGAIRIDMPVNHLDTFTLLPRRGEAEVISLREDRHRLYYEFVEFIDRFAACNKAWRDSRLAMSLESMRVLSLARRDAGIVFPADRS